MKRSYLIALVAAALAVALFLYLRHGKGDSSSATGSDKASPEVAKARQQVTLQRQSGGGDQVAALVDDDPTGTLRLEGQVVNATDDPVAGALVSISSNPPRTAHTEADGSFHFDQLVGRPYQLVARADSGVAGPVTSRLTRKSDPVILRLRPASSVEVTVIAARDRTPIAGATVELRDLEVQSASTDAKGVAHLANVVPGGYRLAASAPGYAMAHTWVRVPPGDVTAVTTMELRHGGPVSGTVTSPAGDPIQGARVVYSGASDWSQQADPRHDAAVTDKDGHYRFDALPAGSFRFVANYKGYAPGSSELVTLDGLSEKGGVNIGLEDGATLTGTVTAGDGTATPSARVRVAVKVVGERWAQPRQAYSDEAGHYEIDGLPRQPTEVVALHESASSQIMSIDLTGKAEAKVNLVLDIAGAISGTVVDSAGEPLEGAQVTAWPDFGQRGRGRRVTRSAMQLRGWQQEMTDAGGRFTIRGLEDGEYELRTTPPGSEGGWGRMMMREGVPAKTGDTDVRIVLPRDGGVKGKVAFDDGTAPSMFTVSVGFRGGSPFSSKDGKFELSDLPPQSYKLQIRGPGFDPKQVPDVKVEEGKVADIGTITVKKGRSIAGQVTASGSPVAGATVRAGRRLFGSGSSTEASFSPFGRDRVRQTETDENGNFVLYGIGPSDVMLVAEHEEKGRSQAVAIRGTRESVTGLQIQLEPFGALSGTVVSGGKPAEDVRVSAGSQTVPSVIYGVATGPDGKFRFDRLAPDTYKVSAIGGGGMMAGMGFHSKVVTVSSGQTAKVDLVLDLGPVTLLVSPKATNQDKAGFCFVNYVQGDVTAATARELELAIAQVPEGRSGFSFTVGGNPARIEALEPGGYTVCATAFPSEVSGMSDTMAYSEREGDNLKVYCQKVTVAAQPAEQNVEIPVEVPAFVPAPSGT